MSKLLVGPTSFEVEFVRDLHSRQTNEDLFGRIDYMDQKIQVDADTQEEMVAVIVWHEVMHAVSDQCGLKLDEDQVRSLGYQVVKLLKDNPELSNVDDMRSEFIPTSERKA